MPKRVHAYYTGSVQGVGFRFTAERVAASLGLKGWVSNLGDGRVEVVCEGAEQALKEFLRRIDDVFSMYIRDKDVEWNEPSGEFDSFDIKFH